MILSLQINMKILLTALILLVLTSTSYAEIIKQSKSGICHDKFSNAYQRTKNFVPFTTLTDCLAQGGRLPKNYKAPSNVNHKNKHSKNKSDYSRSQFGHGWADTDRDCQNSRMETLIAQSVGNVQYKSNKKCRVKSGKWLSLFTGNIIYDATKIDIDHIVPLSWAWKHGAYAWSKAKRVEFANAPVNLISVEASLNRQKSDKGPINWLPPKNKCQYISRFMRVYKTYGLVLSKQESKQYQAIKQTHC